MRTPIELLIFQLQYSYNLNPNPFTASAIESATQALNLEKQHMKTAYLTALVSAAEGLDVSFDKFYETQYTKP
jgi:hypothetical protein